MLTNKNCTKCEDCFLTYAQHPFCRNCIVHTCSMSHTPTCDGRHTCNSTFDLVKHNGKFYCLGHFKILQSRCNMCSIPRPDENEDFQQDHMWYCNQCRKDYKHKFTQAIYSQLSNILNLDIIIEILKKTIVKPKYKYPSEFHIPVQSQYT